MKKAGLTLLEILVASAILAVTVLPTIDLLSSFSLAEFNFNRDINSSQNKIDLSERLSSTIKTASYIYKNNTTMTIPTPIGTTAITADDRAIAMLVPKFYSNGTLMSTSSATNFSITVFSILTENQWNGGNYSKYLLIQSNLDNQMLSSDPNDPINVAISPPTDLSYGKSYILADDLKPANFTNMGTAAFMVSTPHDKITFAFVPSASGTYFPGYGSTTVNDSSFITAVALRNWRKPLN